MSGKIKNKPGYALPSGFEPIGNVDMGSINVNAEDAISIVNPNITFSSENWDVEQGLWILPGGMKDNEGDAFDYSVPFRVVLNLSSDRRPQLKKRRIIDALRVDNGPPGLSPSYPIVLVGGRSGLQAVETGSLAPVTGRNVDSLEIGDPLEPPEEPGTVLFYNVTTARTIVINVAACSDDTALVVGIYNHSSLVWMSTSTCDTDRNPYCLAMDDIQACSGFINLLLDAADGGAPEPYTISIQSADGSEGNFALMISQVSPEGLLFDSTMGQGGADASNLNG